MRFSNRAFETPLENLAFEEAWLEEADRRAGQGDLAPGAAEILRVWEPATPLVVVGRSSSWDEARVEVCRGRNIPVLRRCSGGAAIVAGPGCLMYAVVLDCRLRPQIRAIEHAHRLVLDRVASAARTALPPDQARRVSRQGLSDLTLGDRKFSGNSLRCKRDHILYHGAILYRFPLELISSLLHTAPRQPDYRQGRDHADFVVNAPLDREVFHAALRTAWDATELANDADGTPQPNWSERVGAIAARYETAW